MKTPVRGRLAAPPLHFSSALIVLACDWLVYVVNVMTMVRAFAAVSLVGALVTGLATGWSERHFGRASFRGAALKGAAAACVVYVPFPLLGTVVSIAIVLWTLLAGQHREGKISATS